MKFIWKYYVPLLVLGIGLVTLWGDPAKPILKSVPIVPGENQNLLGVAFLVAGVLLGIAVYLYERKKNKS